MLRAAANREKQFKKTARALSENHSRCLLQSLCLVHPLISFPSEPVVIDLHIKAKDISVRLLLIPLVLSTKVILLRDYDYLLLF